MTWFREVFLSSSSTEVSSMRVNAAELNSVNSVTDSMSLTAI